MVETKKEGKERIQICPYCKQEYSTHVGIDNWKKLFRKPTMEDWISLVILILLIFAAYAYISDSKVCRQIAQDYLELQTACNYGGILPSNSSRIYSSLNFSGMAPSNYSTSTSDGT